MGCLICSVRISCADFIAYSARDIFDRFRTTGYDAERMALRPTRFLPRRHGRHHHHVTIIILLSNMGRRVKEVTDQRSPTGAEFLASDAARSTNIIHVAGS
jgi:hypothetical protein